MPYQREDQADRRRAARWLAPYWPDGDVPEKALDQFIAVFNSVYDATSDDGRAVAAGRAAVRKRYPAGELAEPSHAAAVLEVAEVLLATVGRRALIELERVLRNCDCGKEHEKSLRAVQLALKLAVLKFGGPKGMVSVAKGVRRHEHAAAAVEEWSEQRVKVNEAVVWNMIAKDIYSQGDRVFLAVREMLQNSRDARAKNISVTWEDNPEDAEGRRTGTLTFSDDGRGMDRRIVTEKFMTLGESEKEEGALGGFGAAKAAILTASVNGWDWHLRTRNVEARSSKGGSYTLREVPDVLNGTTLTLFNVLGGFMRSPLGSGEPAVRIRSLMACSDLRGLNVKVNGNSITSFFEGRRSKTETHFEELNWGKFPVAIKSYPRADKKGGAIIVRVKGLAQFGIPSPYGTEFARDYILDFEIPKEITPQTDDYPFKAGRDAFRYGNPAYEAFEGVKGQVTVKAAQGERDLGEYEEIAPDSTDPRERKADAKFADVLDSVMSSDSFAETFSELSTLNAEMDQAIHGNSIGVTISRVGGSESVSPRPEGGSDAVWTPVLLELSNFEQTVLSADSADDRLTRLSAWIHDRLGDEDVTGFDRSIERLRVGHGWARDLETISKAVQGSLTRAAPDTSPLYIASVTSRLLAQLEVKVASSEVAEFQKRKRAGELNPFGSASIWMISRENYGVERGREFRKRSRKYLKHLVWWDFTIRAVLRAMHAAGKITSTNPGIGFVLDDKVMGLTRKDGKYVMINPEIMERVIDTYRDRGFIAASFIHGIAAHEIAHAVRIIEDRSSNHNEDWAILRENIAESTLFLLPAIEAAGQKLVKLRKRQRRKPSAAEADEEMLQRVTALEADLATARERLVEEKERAEHVNHWFSSKGNGLVHQLEELVKLQEFRHWLRANPSLLGQHGVSEAHFFEVLDRPGSIETMLDLVRNLSGDVAITGYQGATHPAAAEVREAYHAACGCGGKKAAGYLELEEKNEHAGMLFDRYPSPFQRGVWGKLGYGGMGMPGGAFSAGMHAGARVSIDPSICPPTKGRYRATKANTPMKRRHGYGSSNEQWDDAMSAAQPLLKAYGFTLGEQVGCGDHACAYEVEDEPYIVKLTSDAMDAAAWTKVIEAVAAGEEWPSGLARTHCAEALPGGKVFLIIQEQLEPMGYDDRELVERTADSILEGDSDAVLTDIQKWINLGEDDDEDTDMDEFWDVRALQVAPLVDAVNWLKAHGIEWHDLHENNVLVTSSGDMKIIDLGHSKMRVAEVPMMVSPGGHAEREVDEVEVEVEDEAHSRVLRGGTPEWKSLVGPRRSNESELDYTLRAFRAAQAAGYDSAEEDEG